MVSCLSVLHAFIVLAVLVPDIGDYYIGGSIYERYLGLLPPLWTIWIGTVLSTILVLVPAVVIGWKKTWYANKVW